VNLYQDSQEIELDELPFFLNKELKKLYSDFLEIEEFPDTVRYVKYPDQTPIAFSNLLFDENLGITSNVSRVFNLQKRQYIELFANGISFYEKVDESKSSFVIFRYSEGECFGFVLIEI